MREMAKIVRETFPKSISVDLDTPDKNLARVKGDATELHQVLLNLCVNARDAMPNGGSLKLSARNITLDAETASKRKCPPGPFVKLTVADTGAGIPDDVLPRIFEPFFTTKLPDKGTTALAFPLSPPSSNNGEGSSTLKRTWNRGTEFHLYLPALPGNRGCARATRGCRAASWPRGTNSRFRRRKRRARTRQIHFGKLWLPASSPRKTACKAFRYLNRMRMKSPCWCRTPICHGHGWDSRHSSYSSLETQFTRRCHERRPA